jgi:hypothetical protein
MWYAETNYPQINADHRSLVVAFANLLQKFNTEIEPAELNLILTQDDPMVDWWSLAEYMGAVDIDEIAAEAVGSWPQSSNTIVKFRRMDTAQAGMVDHYCVVADASMGSIIDSLDGKIKHASLYGEVQGWTSYQEVMDEDDTSELEASALAKAAPKPGTVYTVLRGGETCWEIALKLNLPGMTGNDIATLNSFGEPGAKISEGTLVHLPVAIPQKEEEKELDIEVLPHALAMHVSLEGGTKKQSFGVHRKWKDITPTGPTYPQNTNLKIVAIAHVPIEEEGVEAAYYMDALALGDYADSGRVVHTIGFNHAHLSEGYVERVIVKPKEAEKPEVHVDQTELELPKEEPAAPMVNPDAWKTTQLPLNPHRVPVKYLNPEPVVVEDLEDKRKPRTIKAWSELMLYSTFEKNGVLYGRHIQSVESGNWLGVPMDKLISENELYNTNIPLEDRAAYNGRLTPLERYWYIPLSKSVSQYTRLKTYLGNKKQKEKEQK